jgi:hypothetical protein
MVLDGTRFGADHVNSTFRDPGEYFERPGKIDLIDQRKDQYADIELLPTQRGTEHRCPLPTPSQWGPPLLMRARLSQIPADRISRTHY